MMGAQGQTVASGSLRNALVIEDEPVTRRILEQLLSLSGWKVQSCADAESGIRQLNSGALQLAFVDWNLTHANGLEFIRAARAHPIQKQIKILMITAETDLNHITEALKNGADEYLMKPHTREMVLLKLRMLGF